MTRRDLLSTAAATACAAALPAVAAAADTAPQPATRPGGRTVYELRLYHLRRGPMVKRAEYQALYHQTQSKPWYCRQS